MSELLELLLTFESVDAIGREFESPKLVSLNENAFVVLIKHDFFDEEQRRELLEEAQKTSREAIELLLLSQKNDIESMDTNGNYPMHRACILSNRDLLELFLKEGADVNSRNFDYQCPLHFAAKSNNTDIMEILIQSGANVNATDGGGQTPLHYVFGSGSYILEREKRCAVLLKNGADPNVARAIDKLTVLHAAAKINDRESVELLLGFNANPETYNTKGNSALLFAARFGWEEIVALFIEHMGKSSAVNHQSQDGSRALHYAAAGCQESTCKLLLDSGADVHATDGKGQTALHKTASNYHGLVITLLVHAGALVHASDLQGSTPLHKAAVNGNFDAIVALLENGARTSSRDYLGLTALHSAVAARHDKIIPLLVQNGADINASNFSGVSCLHLAAAGNNRTVLRLLLKLGAKVNATDNSGATALDSAHFAKSKSAQILLKYSGANSGKDLGFMVGISPIRSAVVTEDDAALQSLIMEGHGVNVREKLSGQTPLHLAASVGKVDVVSFLSEKGADMSTRNALGETALHYAVRSKSLETIEYLVSKGLDPHAEDFAGSRPLHIACSLGAEQIVSRFLTMKGTPDNILNSPSTTYGTPVWAASSMGNVSILRELVEAGAGFQTTHSWVGTPLFAACWGGHRDVVKYLLSKGASTVSAGTRFRTATELAEACGQFEIVEILKEADKGWGAKGENAKGEEGKETQAKGEGAKREEAKWNEAKRGESKEDEGKGAEAK